MNGPLRSERSRPEHFLPCRAQSSRYLSRKYFLCRPHSRTKLNSLTDLPQYLLERRQNPYGVEIVVIADVCDTEELAFHLALSVGDHRTEGVAKFLDDR